MGLKLKIKQDVGEAVSTKAIVDNKAKVTVSEETANQKVDGPSGKDLASAEPLAELGVEASFTKNLGNFQSAKVTVSLKLPSPFDELDSRFAFATDWVNGKLESLIADLPE